MEQWFKDGSLVFSLKQLKTMLRYDPATGHWIWLAPNTNSVKIGDRAGANSHGYIRIKIGAKQYASHRLAWFYMTGKWPVKRIDHEDNNPTNNKWNNLRYINHGHNVSRGKVRRDSKSGLKGAYRFSDNRFCSWIYYNKKRIYLGSFKSAIEANRAYMNKANELYGGHR